ncbi:MAG TPA: RNA-binding cell elongation regulator Jag/EloR [Candidatus Binataceae bacterium]|nr:RNA-binding cell elongation regulator Jag/EloR [Candidatus Binataceae bacterium]
MTPNDYIEAEGATVEQAIREALAALGAEEADVSIEVLATPRAGLLGLGVRQARVRVRRRAPEPARSEVASPPAARQRQETVTIRAAAVETVITAPREDFSAAETVEAVPVASPTRREAEARSDEDSQEGGPPRRSASLEDQSQEALKLATDVLELMGEAAEAALSPGDPEAIHIDIKGDGSGILIGRHGQTLDAMEYLINRLLARRIKDAAPVTLDVAAYRARRGQQLERMALAMGERAKRERKTVALEPMAPRDRRIVHLALKDDPLIVTRSLGGGYMRALEIVPAEAAREGGERNPQRRRQPPREPREQRESPPNEQRESPGQQGGFKHGQKRIV